MFVPMFTASKTKWFNNWKPCFDEEGGQSGDGGEGGSSNDENKGPSGNKDNQPPVLDEAQKKYVESLVAKTAEEYKTKIQEASEQLDAIQKSARYNKEDAEKLSKVNNKLKNELKTKEERAAEEKRRLAREHEEVTTQLKSERDEWKTRFETSQINTALTKAATEFEAKDIEDILDKLKPRTQLQPVIDDEGNETGVYREVVKYDTVDKDGKPTVLEISAAEAVKRMAESEKHGHLFKKKGVGGAGRSNDGAGGPSGVLNMSMDEYYKQRNAGTLKLD